MESDRAQIKISPYEQGYQQLFFPPLSQVLLGNQLYLSAKSSSENRVRYELQLPALYNIGEGSKPVFVPGPSNLYSQVSALKSPYAGNGLGSEYRGNAALPQGSITQYSTSTVNSVSTPVQVKLGDLTDMCGALHMPVSQMATPTAVQADKMRRRVFKACERCRVHKIKCTGVHPCHNCSKHGTHCNFNPRSAPEEIVSKRQKNSTLGEHSYKSNTFSALLRQSKSDNRAASHVRSTPLKESDTEPPTPGSPDSERYIRSLEHKVAYLERLLAEKTCLPSAVTCSTATIPSIDYYPASTDVFGVDKNHKNEDEDPDFVYEALGNRNAYNILRESLTKWRVCNKLSICLIVMLSRYLRGNLSKESQAQVESARTQHYGWNMSGCHYLQPEIIPSFPAMPGYSEAEKAELVDFFFAEINPLFALLHESVFREQLNVFFQLQTEPIKHGNRTALFSAMLTLVYALGIRFKEFLKLNGPKMKNLDVEDCLFKYAFRVTLIFLLEWESFELIQCLLLASLYLRITHKQCSFLITLSQALNMGRLMGLGLFLIKQKGPKTYEALKAKRIFFSVFCFDRLLGLQGGKFPTLTSNDIRRQFPLFDFQLELENDDWITLPALAMIHIARLTHYIELYVAGDRDQAQITPTQQDLLRLSTWLDRNGFSEDDITFSAERSDSMPHMSVAVRAQVRLYFCSLVLSIYGKLMIQFLSEDSTNTGAINYDFFLKVLQSSIKILHNVDQANLLFAPWYLTLSTLIEVGVSAQVFMAGGKYKQELKDILQNVLALLRKLQDSLVYDESGKMIFHERFKMVNECVWVLKLINHMAALTHEEALKVCQEIGIDHGSSDVNKETFDQFRERGEKPSGLDELIEVQDSTAAAEVSDTSAVNSEPALKGELIELDDRTGTSRFEASVLTSTSQPDSADFGMDEMFGHLQWFDQWVGAKT